jgi:hypothetical protein
MEKDLPRMTKAFLENRGHVHEDTGNDFFRC